MKKHSMTKILFVLSLGLGLSGVVSAKSPDDPINCYEAWKKCQAGSNFACSRYENYC